MSDRDVHSFGHAGRLHEIEGGRFIHVDAYTLVGAAAEILRLAERERELLASIQRTTDNALAVLAKGAERERKLRKAAEEFLSRILTVRAENTPEWMEHLPEDVNAFAEALGIADRVVLSSDGDHLLIRSEAQPGSTRPEHIAEEPEDCPERWEGGPHRWEPGAPGSPDWCYYCEIEKAAPGDEIPNDALLKEE